MGLVATPLQLVTVLDGITWGVILVLITIGLTLIFGFMEVINFAHGAFYMLGGYTIIAVSRATGNFWLGLAAAPLVVGAVALVVEVMTLRPTYNFEPVTQMLILVGASFIVDGAVVLIWGSQSLSIRAPALLDASIPIGDGVYPVYRLFLLVFGAGAITAVWAFLRYSKAGLVIRASLTDKGMARALGHNIPRLYTTVFVGSIMIAAIAGALMTPLRGVTPGTGTTALILAFVVVVVGGLGSFRGTVVAGLSIGIIDIFVTRYLSFRLSGIIIFVILVLVLMVRPRGLFGEEGVMT